MTGYTATLANRTRGRAHTAAWLTLAVVTIPLVPVPAIIVAIANRSVGIGFHHLPAVVRFIAGATPTFALPAFALGCMIGVVVHLQVNSAERVGATEAARVELLGGRPVVASGLLVGVVFAALGFMVAAALLGMG